MTPQCAFLHTDDGKRFLRMEAVEAKVGLSKRTIQNLVNTGNFPKPISLGDRAIAFVESEVESWMDTKIEERDAGGTPE